MKEKKWVVTTPLPPQGRQDLASFPLHHTPLIRWQIASRSQQTHCLECWMWTWRGRMGRGPGPGSPAQRGVPETNLPAWCQFRALWRVAGIQEERALVCRGIKFNVRVTTDLASRSHCAGVSGSKEKQGCSSDLARGHGGHICGERLKECQLPPKAAFLWPTGFQTSLPSCVLLTQCVWLVQC